MLLANSETVKEDKCKIFGNSGLLICHDFPNAFANNFQFYFVREGNLALTGSNIKLSGLSFIIIDGIEYFKFYLLMGTYYVLLILASWSHYSVMA